MAEKKKRQKIEGALLKVALGCTVEEVTEEYATVDGQLTLTKRKETKKDIPPDLKAVQLLLQESGQDESVMSDEELEEEKKRLLGELEKQSKKEVKEGQVCDEVKKPVKKRAKSRRKIVKKKTGVIKNDGK